MEESNSSVVQHPIKGTSELMRYLEQRIRSGENKTQILNELKPLYPDAKVLSRLIGVFPKEEDRKRFKNINLAIALAFAASTLAGWGFVALNFSSMSLFSQIANGVALLFQGIFLLGAFRLHGNAYPFMVQISAIRLYYDFPGFATLSTAGWLLQALLAMDFLSIPGGVFMWMKVFPYYGLGGLRKNESGDLRVE